MLDAALLQTCAPLVAPQTIAAIVQVESGGDPLAIHINGQKGKVKASSVDEAILLARQAVASGKSVDLGLMQVNSQNLQKLNVSVEDLFNPCINLQAGSAILMEDYEKASVTAKDDNEALKFALSAYNTGNFQTGFENGYVARYDAWLNPIKATPTNAVGNPSSPAASLLPWVVTQNQTNESPYSASTLIYQRRL